MQPLEKLLRNQLEKTIKEAREVAEGAARAALTQFGVGEALPFSHLTGSERELRRKLRAHGRQLGDRRDPDKQTQEIDRLVEEVAYEHWHRMLFARFLAENNLLMYPDPDDLVPITLEECEDLAADEGAKNGWELAARFAAQMLPQIFRPDSPVFQLELAPEHQQKLERLLVSLPIEVFTASDSLGWVYQFWQARKKDEVNASEVKRASFPQLHSSSPSRIWSASCWITPWGRGGLCIGLRPKSSKMLPAKRNSDKKRHFQVFR